MTCSVFWLQNDAACDGVSTLLVSSLCFMLLECPRIFRHSDNGRKGRLVDQKTQSQRITTCVNAGFPL